MVLPLLFSFLAPQLLGGTALGATLGTAGLSALGAGLGGFAQTGDLEKGLLTGLGAFAGGQLLGPMLGGGSGALTETLPGQISTGGALSGQTALAAGNPGIVGMAPEQLMPPVATGAGASAAGFSLPSMKELGAYAMSPTGMATGLGAMAGGAAADMLFKDKDEKPKKSKYADMEMKPIPRMASMPGADYQPGRSGEFNYGISTPQSAEDLYKYNTTGVYPYANGGMLQRMARPNIPGMGPVRLAGGGIVALAKGGDPGQQMPNEREVISGAIAAVKGQHPQPEIALGAFLAQYGEAALRQLVDAVQSGEMGDTAERFAQGENGEVRGPGDDSGVDDMVPAKMDDGSGDVLLSDGEFVLRKDATDSLERRFGGGFLDSVNKAGPKAAQVAQRRMAAA
jgi:hypothetical protein